MNPIEAYKLSLELANARPTTVLERSKNRKQNLKDALSIVPGIGHAIAAYDAGESGGKAFEAFSEGDLTGGAVNTGMAGLSGLGAVLGLPVGRTARKATKDASRTTHIFAGPSAKTADLSALDRAKAMEKELVDRDAILDQTGWFRGVDGKWKFEISDDTASVNLTPEMYGTRVRADKIGQAVDHPDLFAAYPELAEFKLTQSGRPKSGAYYSDQNRVDIGPYNTATDKRTVTHELQHATQKRESFGGGGSPEAVRDLPETQALANQYFDEMKEFVLLPDAQIRGMAEGRAMDDVYRRLAGEVEARNVETRMNMTPAERRAKGPWKTQAVPDDKQIVQFDVKGPQNVFVPADTAPGAPRATQTYDELVDDVGMDAANRKAFDETGLFYGPEGALRREIPDNMTFKIQPRAGESHLLGDVIDHPELFKEYPAFKDIPVEFTGSDISTGALTARTNPTTGAFEVAAGQTEPQLRAQFAKLLQYNIDPRSGFANASRETAKHKIDAAQSTIENVRKAMADDLIPAEYGEKYIRSLQGALGESDKIRTGAPGTLGEGTTNKARRALQSGFWSRHSAGNQQVKAVKHRAYHGKGGYPYDPRAASLEDQVSLPAGDIPPESLADFVARWNQYGSGRVKR